jgi:hypothetical protein
MKKMVQQLLINPQGYVIESNDSLFSTFPQRHYPVTDWSAFVASIFQHLLHLPEHQEIAYPNVESTLDGLQGAHRYLFSKVYYNDTVAILWTIEPCPQYAAFDLQRFQPC